MKLLNLMFPILLFTTLAHAKTVRYELTVENKRLNMSGKKEVDFALTVNGGIPAPTLEFTEGDDAEILVRNKLPNEEVSIHWHGILLPPEEDGVAYVNTPPIFAGKERLFKFKIRQNGTYWYHSHTMVQEQKGVYGAFIIHPKKKAIQYDKDAVLVLSDWSDENADQIIRNLRKDGDYYLFKKDSMRSYFGAVRAGGLKTHLQNEWTRMGGMDLSDVGYDAFLINGKRDSQILTAHPGEKIRLRIINAGASSYFYVSMGLPMTVISADGVDVKPVQTKEILMGMAETYDVLFTVPEHKNYEIRATVQDVTGFASAWIGMGEKVLAPSKPLPNMYASMDHAGHGGAAMPGMDHSAHGATTSSNDHSKMDHSKMHGDHSDHGNAATSEKAKPIGGGHADHAAHAGHGGHQAPPAAMDHSAHATPKNALTKKSVKPSATVVQHNDAGPTNWSTQSDAMLRQNGASRDLKASESEVLETLSVDALTAIAPTALPKDAKVHELKLVLGGDMERYVWHINGKAISQDRLININKGEVVRFIFQNDTMMHHPMHLHGHFFRVVNAQGDKSPLKHTVDVPPHGSRTIEFYANEPGQWMLHCHNLYHMKTGMARVVRYNNFKLAPEMAAHDQHDPHLHEHLYTHTQLKAASNHAEARFRLMRTWDEIEIKAETRKDEKWAGEGDLFYRRWVDNYLSFVGGGSVVHGDTRAELGVGYVLPMLIHTNLLIDHKGKLRVDLEKHFQWTSSVFSEVEYTWRQDGALGNEVSVSLMYGPSWAWAFGLKLTEHSLGAGLQYQF